MHCWAGLAQCQQLNGCFTVSNAFTRAHGWYCGALKETMHPSACFPGCQSSNIFISQRKAAPFHNIYFKSNWVLFLSNKSSGAGDPEMSHNTCGLQNHSAAISRELTGETKPFWWLISLVPPLKNTGKKNLPKNKQKKIQQNFSLSLNRVNQLEVHTKPCGINVTWL